MAEEESVLFLTLSSFSLAFSGSVALSFTKALALVGHNDPLLKPILPVLNNVFSASFYCFTLGNLVTLILHSRREYHRYRKFCLIVTNAAMFLFMILGFAVLDSFKVNHPRWSIKA